MATSGLQANSGVVIGKAADKRGRKEDGVVAVATGRQGHMHPSTLQCLTDLNRQAHGRSMPQRRQRRQSQSPHWL